MFVTVSMWTQHFLIMWFEMEAKFIKGSRKKLNKKILYYNNIILNEKIDNDYCINIT